MTVCVKCKRRMIPLTNGVLAVEHAEVIGPYRVWQADEMACEVCELMVLTGFGKAPIMEHFQEGFKEKLEAMRLELKRDFR